MAAKKCFIYFLIILLLTYPVSAADISLNRWVLNVTLHEDGVVEELIQAEIENGGSVPLDGFSFVVPASEVTVLFDQFISIPATGQVVEQQTVADGIKIIINFNNSVKAGQKWDGRFGIRVENWAVKEGSNYSIDIPVKAPQAIVSGKNIELTVPEDADIRSQVFLPKSYEVTYVTPNPFRILFQYDHMVPTWSPDKLRIGDTISIESSFSSSLKKIVETDEKSRELADRIKKAKSDGMDVSEAELHLSNAEAYNTVQALASFWKKEDTEVLRFVGYANDELKLAEDSLLSAGKADAEGTPEETANKTTPGFGAIFLMVVLFIIRSAVRKK